MNKDTITVPGAIIIAGVLIAGAILFGFVYMKGEGSGTGGTPTAQNPKIPAIGEGDHVIGNPKTAEITLVEYSDLQCPYCTRFHPVVEQVVKDYGGKVAWAYRHFPLSQIHPEALPASIASECVASLKGTDAFFNFVNDVFLNQGRIGISLYRELGAKAGISAGDLDACIAKNESEAKIKQQFADAVGAGGQGTPFTIILDKKGKTLGVIPGALPIEQVKAQIDALLK